MNPSIAAPKQARPATGLLEPALLDPLLRLAGDVRNVHALIVADHGLDLMCGLIRRGCLAATILCAGDKPDAAGFGLVLMPEAPPRFSQDELIQLARRALAAKGRLIAGAYSGKAAAALGRRLRLNGFTNLRSTHLPGLTVLRADLRSQS